MIFFLVVLASILLGINPALCKQLSVLGLSPITTVFWFHLFIATINLILALIGKDAKKPTKQQFVECAISGFCFMGGTFFLLNLSYQFISVGLSTLIHFFYPTIVCMAMIAFFREKFTLKKLLSFAFSIAGMYFVVGINSKISFIGVIMAFCSAITYGCFLITSEKGNISKLPINIRMTCMLYPSAFAFGIIGTTTGQLQVPPNSLSFILLLIISIFALIAYNILSMGVKKIGSSTTAFLTLFEPITSVVTGALLYKDSISVTTIVGCVFILISMQIISTEKSKQALSH